MKKTVLLHVFSTIAIISTTQANAGTAIPWTPGSTNEGLAKELAKSCKAGEKLFAVKIATQGLTVGQTIDLEIVPSNRGNYSFLAETNFVAINEARQAQIRRATEDKALQLEKLATKAQINTIKELRNETDLTDAERALIMANAGKGAISSYQDSMNRRNQNYRNRASNRPVISAADFSNAFTAQDQTGD